ncbi:hypothetical protein BZA77DRAFT_321170 [Pyronema omphalodes]|nr:hypothetical protein BZA77DRAFT_321170 [Pyronema omphalodes]
MRSYNVYRSELSLIFFFLIFFCNLSVLESFVSGGQEKLYMVLILLLLLLLNVPRTVRYGTEMWDVGCQIISCHIVSCHIVS